MNEKVKQAFKLLCEQYVKDLNRYENKEIAKDYFYNPKYECGFKIDGKNVYFADILKAFDSMEELIKGKDEYIAKLCNDRAELKEEIKRLDSQYKNIHNTKVKVPLCDILNGLSRTERERVIEDIYYSQAERQDFYDNKISKLENEIAKLKDENRLLNDLQMFKKFICEGVLVARAQNHTRLQLHLTPELKDWCEKEMNKKGGEKCGN